MKHSYSLLSKLLVSICASQLVITKINPRGITMKMRSNIFILLTLCGSLCINMPTGLAENVKSVPTALEAALDMNGKLIPGIDGSFNAQGFEMQYGKNGEPLFSEQSSGGKTNSDSKSGVITWSVLGAGLNYNVTAIAVSGRDVYVGGQFTTAGGISANRIAKWNGTSWSALGSGVNAIVQAIAVSGNDVYVGGQFTIAGGISVNRIAKWNGSSWSALGTGLNSFVYAIAVSGGDVYAGGPFTTAGGSSANYIAKWDGSNWSALGAGVNMYVHAITISGSDVYAGGQFTSPGNRIAKWNGSSWSALGTGMNDVVFAIAVSGNDIYAGGQFTVAGGNPAGCIAKWNGSNWSDVGTALGGFVYAIAVSGTDVYAGGSFLSGTVSPARNIAKWNGSSWSALGGGAYSTVYALAINTTEGKMIVGGTFTYVDAAMSANYIASFTDSENTFPFAMSIKKPMGGTGSTTLFGDTKITFTGDVTVSDSVTVYYYQVPPAPGELPSGIIRIGDYYWRIQNKGLIFTNGYIRISTQDLYGVTAGGCGACLVWLKRSGSGDPWQNFGGIFSGTFDNGFLLSKFPFDSFSEFTIGVTEDLTTNVPESLDEKSFKLSQNYPNPFNQTTKIRYELTYNQMVTLNVYDLFGKEIKALVNEEKSAGLHEVDFDASGIAPGIYIYKLQSGSSGTMKKMIILK
jgi:hypothetical protein